MGATRRCRQEEEGVKRCLTVAPLLLPDVLVFLTSTSYTHCRSPTQKYKRAVLGAVDYCMQLVAVTVSLPPLTYPFFLTLLNTFPNSSLFAFPHL